MSKKYVWIVTGGDTEMDSVPCDEFEYWFRTKQEALLIKRETFADCSCKKHFIKKFELKN